MKKVLCLFSGVIFLFSAGCSVPLISETEDIESKAGRQSGHTGENEPVYTLPDDTGSSKGVLSSDPYLDPEYTKELRESNRESDSVNPPGSSASGNGSGNDKRENENGNGNSANPGAKPAKMPVTLYYSDEDNCLIPVVRWIDRQPAVVKAAIESLTAGKRINEKIPEYGLYPVLPKGTEIRGINITDEVAVLDFNERFDSFKNEENERVGITSIVYSLTEFDNIKGIRILVEGAERDTLVHGTDISGVIERNDIFINIYGQEGIYNNGYRTGLSKVDVFFVKQAKKNYHYLLPVSVRSDEYMGENVAPAAVVQFLLKTEPGGKIYSEIPNGTGLLGCKEKNGVLVLDFDENFINYGGSSREDYILKQLLYSLKQNSSDIKKVKILINGSQSVLPEGTDVSEGIKIPQYINDVIDK